MKIINFINPVRTTEGYDTLVQCVMAGFEYQQTNQTLRGLGYYIPEDQFKAFEEVLNIMVAMDIGDRVLGL